MEQWYDYLIQKKENDYIIDFPDGSKGKIEIEYYSMEELDRIIDLLRTITK